MLEINSPIIGPVSLSVQLDRGGFGNVWRGYSVKLNATIAIKFCKKDSNAEREFRYGQLMNHPLALQCFTYYSTASKCIGFMPCLEGLNLRDLVNKNGPFADIPARIIIIELVSVLDYLHNELEMIHRDIKLENVIVDTNGNAHLIDFGFMTPPTEKKTFVTELCGTPKYFCPELIKTNSVSYPSDIWSLGVLLYTMVTGHFPFAANTSKELYDQICHNEVQFPQSIEPSLKDLISCMLEKDPSKRITLDEIMKHPWINPSVNGVKRFANFDVLRNLRLLPDTIDQIDHEIVSKICEQCFSEKSKVEKEVLENQNTFNVVMYKLERLKKIEPYMENITAKIFDSDVQLSSSVLPRIGTRKTLTFNHQQKMAKQIRVEVRQKARTRLILPLSRCVPHSSKHIAKPLQNPK